jgi:hypothetical protein
MTASPTKRARWARRLAAPVVLLLLLVLTTLGGWVRGTWADDMPRTPASVAEGPVCHVYEDAVGKQVRCAIRLPFALDEVWAAITDYEHFGDICPYLHGTRIEQDPDGRCRLESRVESLPSGQIPFAVEMRHEQQLFQYVSCWDQADGNVLVNRGRWELTPLGPRETLLAVSMEVEVRGVPTFILRNISLERLPVVALAVSRRLETGPTNKEW